MPQAKHAHTPPCAGCTATGAVDLKTIWSSLDGALLTARTGMAVLELLTESDADREVIARVHSVALKRKWTMSQVALAWLNKRTTAPVVGLHSTSRMDEALAIRGQHLSDEDEAYLEAPYQPKNIQGHS